MKNMIKFLLYFTIVSSSASYNAMGIGSLARFNPVNIIANLFRSAQTQPVIQAQNQAVQQIVKRYPTAIPYTQHTQIRAPMRLHTMDRLEWEEAARQTARTISEEDIRYSFEIWCKRLKADAHNTARNQGNPHAFSIAPNENPELILAQLATGYRPLIQKNR